MKTARWQHLNKLKTDQRILLSGTPVQNNLRELLVLLDFLRWAQPALPRSPCISASDHMHQTVVLTL